MLLARNKLLYPAGTPPGFDPSHVAGAARFSSVATMGGSHVNVLTGSPGTIVGTVTPKFNGVAGPGIQVAAGATAGISFSGVAPTASPGTIVTLAAIFSLDGNGTGFDEFFNQDNSNLRGYGLYTPSGAAVGIVSSNVGGSGALFSSIPANVPHFIVVSNFGSSVTSYATLVNLATGVTKTTSYTGLSINNVSSSGTYCVGNAGTAAASGSGTTVYATMLLLGTIPLAQQTTWSADPWSFWYPDQMDYDFAVGTVAAIVSKGGTLSMMGV